MGKDSSSSKHSRSGTSPPLSFLFVVNEMRIAHSLTDSWGNPCPPQSPSAYGPETPSLVMRYHGGVISAVPDTFYWDRLPANSNRGAIFYLSADGLVYPCETYKTATVFSCHPLLPVAMVDVDASVEQTFNKHDVDEDDAPVWEPLQFFHPRNEMKGVSQAIFSRTLSEVHYGGRPVKYLCGKGPVSKYLVPPTYAYPNRHPPVSRGLGGEITILLGLMAFSAAGDDKGNRADKVFLGRPHGRWYKGRWEHDGYPEGYTSSTQSWPQGFVISVALDPTNPLGSTAETLNAFEFGSIIIKDKES